eukprot:GHVN01011705.1.p2 GENE.GHVN01011705.1~~GHVN01011705.1.p2  ORF type:complete len:202 (-),score=30.56 GHVN01011705.1:159-764(-)
MSSQGEFKWTATNQFLPPECYRGERTAGPRSAKKQLAPQSTPEPAAPTPELQTTKAPSKERQAERSEKAVPKLTAEQPQKASNENSDEEAPLTSRSPRKGDDKRFAAQGRDKYGYCEDGPPNDPRVSSTDAYVGYYANDMKEPTGVAMREDSELPTHAATTYYAINPEGAWFAPETPVSSWKELEAQRKTESKHRDPQMGG